MYNFTMYSSIWAIMFFGLLPFAIISLLAIVLQKIKAHMEYLKSREKQLKNIDYITSLLRDNPTQDKFDDALASFRENFLHFEDLKKETHEYQQRIDFITALASCSLVLIENIASYREEFVKANPVYKKEIEQAVGAIIKNREAEKKKNK